MQKAKSSLTKIKRNPNPRREVEIRGHQKEMLGRPVHANPTIRKSATIPM
jgi:hypothetical protein